MRINPDNLKPVTGIFQMHCPGKPAYGGKQGVFRPLFIRITVKEDNLLLYFLLHERPGNSEHRVYTQLQLFLNIRFGFLKGSC